MAPLRNSKLGTTQGVPGDQAMRVDVTAKGANLWDVGALSRIQKPIASGDAILVAVYLRAPKLKDGETTAIPFMGATEAAAHAALSSARRLLSVTSGSCIMPQVKSRVHSLRGPRASRCNSPVPSTWWNWAQYSCSTSARPTIPRACRRTKKTGRLGGTKTPRRGTSVDRPAECCQSNRTSRKIGEFNPRLLALRQAMVGTSGNKPNEFAALTARSE
jgi:hypothetical protein